MYVNSDRDTYAYFDEQHARFHKQCARFQEQQQRFHQLLEMYVSQVERNRRICAHRESATSATNAPPARRDHAPRPLPPSREVKTPPVVVSPAPTDVTDQQWQAIAPLLQRTKKSGRPPADARNTLNGILYVVRRRCAWRALPHRYGNYVTCWRRLFHWQQDGTWQRIAAILGLDPCLASSSGIQQPNSRRHNGNGQTHPQEQDGRRMLAAMAHQPQP
jgi:hypothetical protein